MDDFLMKRVLHLATKLNSRDIKKNVIVFGYLRMKATKSVQSFLPSTRAGCSKGASFE